jgi:hypothetical protein
MLMKWMLAFGLQGTALITITPAGLAAQAVRQFPTHGVKQTLGHQWDLASEELSLLDFGFRSMYNLDFSSAQRQFMEYERENPNDPMGPVAQAAGLLFSDFNRLGVLQSQMFLKNPSFPSRNKLVAGPAVVGKFELEIRRSRALAQRRLAGDDSDRDALLALAFAAGLQAECSALMQNRGVAALRYARQAASYAQRLLTVSPDWYGAYLAADGGGYWIGSRTVQARWILRTIGFAGDKREGVNELQIVAQHGYYLAPFAEILLTIAYFRDKEPLQARLLLAELRVELSQNPLFAPVVGEFGGAAEP